MLADVAIIGIPDGLYCCILNECIGYANRRDFPVQCLRE
jgi:hypothetical protein